VPPPQIAPRRYSFGRRPADAHLPSVGISIAITGVLFAVALISMRTVLVFTNTDTTSSAAVMVPLSPPTPPPQARRDVAPVAPPKPIPPKTAVEQPTSPATPVVPAVTAPNVSTPPIARAATAPRPPIPRAVRDSGTGDEKSTAPVGQNSTSAIRAGAPVAPAGVTSPSSTERAARDPEYRVVAPAVSLGSIAEAARKPLTGQELADQQLAQRQADRLGRRATTAGNSQDLHVPVGQGAGGAGVSGGLGAGGSIPLPFLSRGPSRAQRARDEKIDADNRARLGRFAALIKARRDSALADSVRRDSVRADSLRRRIRRDSVDLRR
jgi:hypothetical protein